MAAWQLNDLMAWRLGGASMIHQQVESLNPGKPPATSAMAVSPMPTGKYGEGGKGQWQDEGDHNPAELGQAVMLAGHEDQIEGVDEVVGEKEPPLPAGDEVAGEEDGQAGQSHRDHDR